jgi:phage terminase large subunit
MFHRTRAINKILQLKKRKKVIQGGTWAGKTFGIMAVIVDYLAKNPNRNLTVVVETIPAVKKGALKDFKDVMAITGRWNENSYNNTDRIYKFANGSVIEFSSFDSVGKAQQAGKRTDLFINEAPYIPFPIADALMMRTSNNIWIDFNPTSEFWAHTEIANQEDADFLILKYHDNEALPETIRKELLMKVQKAEAEKAQGLPVTSYWQNWCRVYIDGEIGSLQGVVFNNWDQVPEVPLGSELLGVGMDFGFSNHPTTAIKVFRYNGELYCDELIYETGLLHGALSERLKSCGVTNYMEVVADCAEPRMIAELRKASFRMSEANKGPDSVRAGIAMLQDFKIHVTERSTNLIKELRNYRWKVDKSGKTENDPIDAHNHGIDAIRYVALNKIGKNTGKYSFM